MRAALLLRLCNNGPRGFRCTLRHIDLPCRRYFCGSILVVYVVFRVFVGLFFLGVLMSVDSVRDVSAECDKRCDHISGGAAGERLLHGPLNSEKSHEEERNAKYRKCSERYDYLNHLC